MKTKSRKKKQKKKQYSWCQKCAHKNFDSTEAVCILKVQISAKRNLFIYLLFLVPKPLPSVLSMHASPSTKHFLILVSVILYAQIMSWKLL